MRKKYCVISGIDYDVKGKPHRAEPSHIVDNIPVNSLPWLLRQNIIHEVVGERCEEHLIEEDS